MPREPAATASVLTMSSCARRSSASRVVGEELERERLQRIAHEQRGGLVELDVHRGLAAPQDVVVHAGKIVVHERIGVDQLDRARGRLAAVRPRRRRLRPRRKRAAAAPACRLRASRSASRRAAARARCARAGAPGERGLHARLDSPIHPWKSLSRIVIGACRLGERLQHVALQDLDLLLRHLELLLADTWRARGRACGWRAPPRATARPLPFAPRFFPARRARPRRRARLKACSSSSKILFF